MPASIPPFFLKAMNPTFTSARPGASGTQLARCMFPRPKSVTHSIEEAADTEASTAMTFHVRISSTFPSAQVLARRLRDSIDSTSFYRGSLLELTYRGELVVSPINAACLLGIPRTSVALRKVREEYGLQPVYVDGRSRYLLTDVMHVYEAMVQEAGD